MVIQLLCLWQGNCNLPIYRSTYMFLVEIQNNFSSEIKTSVSVISYWCKNVVQFMIMRTSFMYILEMKTGWNVKETEEKLVHFKLISVVGRTELLITWRGNNRRSKMLIEKKRKNMPADSPLTKFFELSDGNLTLTLHNTRYRGDLQQEIILFTYLWFQN